MQQTIASFNSKLFNPCKRLLRRLLRLPYRSRPISIKSLRRRRRRRFGYYLRWLLPLSKSRTSTEEMDRLRELKSMTERDWTGPYPSPLTPAYVKLQAAARRREEEEEEGVEEACRCFQNYLVEMIVDERKVRDLMDVEELLYCWDGLKSPVFVDLVGRFYGELCRDLFSDKDQDEMHVEVGKKMM